jgi:hypothetical protein
MNDPRRHTPDPDRSRTLDQPARPNPYERVPLTRELPDNGAVTPFQPVPDSGPRPPPKED